MIRYLNRALNELRLLLIPRKSARLLSLALHHRYDQMIGIRREIPRAARHRGMPVHLGEVRRSVRMGMVHRRQFGALFVQLSMQAHFVFWTDAVGGLGGTDGAFMVDRRVLILRVLKLPRFHFSVYIKERAAAFERVRLFSMAPNRRFINAREMRSGVMATPPFFFSEEERQIQKEAC